jgi:hypothetical protein
MEVGGKERNVAVSHCDDPEFLADLCQVTGDLKTGSDLEHRF